MTDATDMEKNEDGEYVPTKKEKPPERVIVERGGGGGFIWLLCIILVLAIIHFSCQAGTATGYVGNICTNGMQLQDFLGLICCAPIYLLIIVILSGGLRIW